MPVGIAPVTNGDNPFNHDDDYKDDMNDAWASDDEEEEEDAQESLDLALGLREAVPVFFLPSNSPEPEQKSLFHHDLSLSDTPECNPGTGECVTAVPDWKACQLAEFWLGGPRKGALPPRT